MTEDEMKKLLWTHPEEFFSEQLTRFRREMSLNEGRADLVFEDANKFLLVLEVKLGRADKGSLGQVVVYGVQLKNQCAPPRVRCGLLANSISVETKRACLEMNVECYEVPEEKFRQVAERSKFTFHSESFGAKGARGRSRVGDSQSGRGASKRHGRPRHEREDPGRKPVVPCPSVPEAAWPDLGRTYRDAVARSTEASDNWHLAGFLAVAASGLGKSVHAEDADEGTYPNPYFSLVGTWRDLEERQDAIKFAADLSRDASPEVVWLDHEAFPSRQQFIQWQSRLQREHPERRLPTVVAASVYGPDLVECSHRKSLAALGLTEFLGELFYRPPEELHWSGRKHSVLNDPPPVCILGKTDLRWSRIVGSDQAQRGLAGYVMFLPGEAKMIACPEAPSKGLWKKAVAGLREVFEFWSRRGSTELTLTEPAEELWHECILADDARAEGKGLMDLLCRHEANMLKVASIFAALEKSLLLDVKHVMAAQAFADFLFDSLRYVFPEFIDGGPPSTGWAS